MINFLPKKIISTTKNIYQKGFIFEKLAPLVINPTKIRKVKFFFNSADLEGQTFNASKYPVVAGIFLWKKFDRGYLQQKKKLKQKAIIRVLYDNSPGKKL